MADPFLHVETGLKQIDLDLNARCATLIQMVTAVATQYGLGFIQANIDIPLSQLEAAISGGSSVPITAISLTPVTVTATATALIATNATRKYLSIVNNSATPIYIKFGSGATTADLYLGAKGQWDTTGLPGPYTGPVSAITATGSAAVHVLEGTP